MTQPILDSLVAVNLSIDCFAEGEEGEFHQFEMLQAEWYADYGYAEEYTPAEMRECYDETSYKPPDDVHYCRETTGWPSAA